MTNWFMAFYQYCFFGLVGLAKKGRKPTFKYPRQQSNAKACDERNILAWVIFDHIQAFSRHS